jgi:hypothetical protein
MIYKILAIYIDMSDREELDTFSNFTERNSNYFYNQAVKQIPHPDPEKNESLREEATRLCRRISKQNSSGR